MIAKPVVGLLLRSQNVTAAHAGGKDRNPIFAGLISAGLSQCGPEVGFGQVGRNPSTRPVVSAQTWPEPECVPVGGASENQCTASE